MKLAITHKDVSENLGELIFYSVNTLWWTHNPDDLDIKTAPIPLDIFGSPLYQSDNVKGWLNEEAIIKHDAYGEDVNHRLETFMWSHHSNIQKLINSEEFKALDISEEDKKSCITSFKELYKILVRLGVFK